MPTGFAIQWLVPHLSSFNFTYPGINVRIQAVDREEDKLADDVDMAIFYGRGNWPGLPAECLYAEYFLPVCSSSLLSGGHPLKEAGDFVYHTLLHILHAATGWPIPASWSCSISMCGRGRSSAIVLWSYRLRWMGIGGASK